MFSYICAFLLLTASGDISKVNGLPVNQPNQVPVRKNQSVCGSNYLHAMTNRMHGCLGRKDGSIDERCALDAAAKKRACMQELMERPSLSESAKNALQVDMDLLAMYENALRGAVPSEMRQSYLEALVHFIKQSDRVSWHATENQPD